MQDEIREAGPSLGFSPARLDDELLYSVLARYFAMRQAKPAVGAVLKVAFGFPPDRFRRVRVLAPIAIGHFARSLPDRPDPVELVDRHTVLPYFSRFMEAARYRDIHASLIDNDLAPRSWTPNTKAKTMFKPRLAFCPACVAADATEYSFPSWRRTHQMAGVFVCHVHGTPLRETTTRTTSIITLTNCPNDPAAGQLLANPFDADTTSKIARYTAWLMENPAETAPKRSLRMAAETLIADRRLSDRFEAALLERFGDEALDGVGWKADARGHRLPKLWSGARDLIGVPLWFLMLLVIVDRPPADLFEVAAKKH